MSKLRKEEFLYFVKETIKNYPDYGYETIRAVTSGLQEKALNDSERAADWEATCILFNQPRCKKEANEKLNEVLEKWKKELRFNWSWRRD